MSHQHYRKVDQHELLILVLVAENPCLYLHEMYVNCGGNVSGSTVCPVLHKMGFTGKKCKPLLCNNNSIHSGHFMSLLLHLSALCELMRLEVMPEVTSENLDTNYGASHQCITGF